MTAQHERSLRRRENTRARLLAAAEEVFVRQGFGHTTVDKLVAEAGFTRGAFYSNFSSIKEVFFAVFDEQSRRMLALVESAVRAVPEEEFSVETLTAVLASLDPVSERWFVLQTEFTLLGLRDDEARTFLQEHRIRFEDQMQALIADVVRRLGRVPSVPLEQLSETAVGLYVHSLGQAALGFGTLTPHELATRILPGVVVGLSREA